MGRRQAQVTISMTVYDTPTEMLRRAVDGIRGQSMRDWRLIIVRDGGDPACWQALDGIRDRRILRIDHADNLGTYARHSETLAMCKTSFWSPHDSDDWCDPDRYTQLLSASRDGSDVILGGYTNVMPNGRSVPAPPFDTPKPSRTVKWMKHVTSWAGGLWSTDWLRRAGGINGTYRTSYDSVLQTLALIFSTVDTISHTGCYRTIRAESLTSDSRTGYGSVYRRASNRHLGKLINSLPAGTTLEQAGLILGGTPFVYVLPKPKENTHESHPQHNQS